jgi:hypothetical protein
MSLKALWNFFLLLVESMCSIFWRIVRRESTYRKTFSLKKSATFSSASIEGWFTCQKLGFFCDFDNVGDISDVRFVLFYSKIRLLDDNPL